MRMHKLAVVVCLTICGLFPVVGTADPIIDETNPWTGTVPEVVERIAGALERRGFEIPLIADHAAAAESVGLALPPTQVILARPPGPVERALLARSGTVGIDLPLRFLVFERDGMVHVNINPLGYLVDRNDVTTTDPLFRALDAAIERFGAAPTGLVTVRSLQTFEDTLESLEMGIESNPAFRIPLVLDYGADGRTGGSEPPRRPPVLIVFGNPNVGTPLMQASRETGIDLPQKFLVWEDREGAVQVTYNDPFFVARRHGVAGQEPLLESISEALQQLALIGAGQ
jgi:uncharacterized protein (DUF302 family)